MAQPRRIPTEILPGYNATGSTIAEALVVSRGTSGTDKVVLPSAADAFALGVTVKAILDGEVGDIQTRGKAILTGSTSITAGARLMVGTDGKVATWSQSGGTNAAVIGVADQDCSGDGVQFEATLTGPGGSRQG